METDLSPKLPQKLFDGDGGSYFGWASSELPILSDAKLGAGKLVLTPLGLAPPHYADSTKVGYVVEGRGIAGLVLPGCFEERVVRLTKGDIIVVPTGTVSWWYTDGDSELVIVFLGVTPSAYHPGEFTYFLLTGAQGIFTGFSTEFISRAWDIGEEEAKKLFTSQPGFLLVKAKEKLHGLEPNESDAEGIIRNIEKERPAIDVKKGGRSVVVTSDSLPKLKEVGFYATHVTLDPGAMSLPGFSPDSAAQVVYVIRGSGKIQIVGLSGARVLDAKVEEGYLFVVPPFFAASIIADGEGMEWFSIITSTQPVYSHLVGKTSLLKAFPPQVLEVSLNAAPDLVRLLRTKRSTDAVFVPPPN